MVELQCLMCHNIWEGNIGSYCPVCYSKEGLTKTLMDATARIAALESALAERERECDRLRGELAGSDVNVRELWARAESAESALAAARDDHRTWPTATSGCPAEPHMVSESELAALRARADDAGRVDEGAPRKALAWFARRMERKLKMNDHKDHWTTCETQWLFCRVLGEAQELLSAMPDEPWELSEEEKDRIIDEAADVANFAMMIADIARQAMPKARAVLAAADEKPRGE